MHSASVVAVNVSAVSLHEVSEIQSSISSLKSMVREKYLCRFETHTLSIILRGVHNLSSSTRHFFLNIRLDKRKTGIVNIK